MTNKTTTTPFYMNELNQIAMGAGAGGLVLIIIIIVLACALRIKSTESKSSNIEAVHDGTVRRQESVPVENEVNPSGNISREKSARANAHNQYSDIDLSEKTEDNSKPNGVSHTNEGNDQKMESSDTLKIRPSVRTGQDPSNQYSDIDLQQMTTSYVSKGRVNTSYERSEHTEQIEAADSQRSQSVRATATANNEVIYAPIIKPVRMIDNDLYGTG